jgi:hypothetical protein
VEAACVAKIGGARRCKRVDKVREEWAEMGSRGIELSCGGGGKFHRRGELDGHGITTTMETACEATLGGERQGERF